MMYYFMTKNTKNIWIKFFDWKKIMRAKSLIAKLFYIIVAAFTLRKDFLE